MLTYYHLIISFVLAYFVLTLGGMPIVCLFKSYKSKAISSVISAPVYGFGIIMVLSKVLFRFGISVIESYIWVLGFIVLVGCFLCVKTRYYLSFFHYWKVVVIIIIGLIIVASLVFLPVKMRDGEWFASLGHANTDWAFYGLEATLIKHAGYKEALGLIGGVEVLNVVNYQTRGALFIADFFSCLFKLSIFQAMDCVLLMVFVFDVILGGLLAYSLSSNRVGALLSGIIIAFNSGYINMFHFCFFGQVAAIPFLILINIITISNLSYIRFEKIDFDKAILIGLVSSFIVHSYLEMIPFLGLYMCIFFVFAILKKRTISKNLVVEYVISFAITIGLCFETIIHSFKALFRVATVDVGWQYVPGGLLQALGLYNVYIGAEGATDILVLSPMIVVTITVIMLIIMVHFVNFSLNTEAKSLVLSMLLVYSFLYGVFLFIFPSYHVVKYITIVQYIYLIIFGIMCSCSCKGKSLFVKFVRLFEIITCIFIVLTGADYYYRLFSRHEDATIARSVSLWALAYEKADNHAELSDFFDTMQEEDKIVIR